MANNPYGEDSPQLGAGSFKSEKYQITSSCPDQTLDLGIRLGRYAEAGSVIALSGGLGSGKTCLTQGIAKGLHVPEAFSVTSPSFAILHEYPGRLRLFHVDLYRINDILELDEIGIYELLKADGVTVVEWAEKFMEVLPEERLEVFLSITGENARKFYLTAHGQSAINLARKVLGKS